jgi:GNAT superfamily N-acetyltransferase
VSDPATQRMAERVAGSLAGSLPGSLAPGLRLRDVEDGDGPALLALIGAAYDEYACGPLDPDGFDADLSRPASVAAERGRRWWVVVGEASAGGPVLASVAHGPLRTPPDRVLTVELHRLYLAPEVRGSGLATALVGGIAAEARLAGAVRLWAWSDTRLVDAHRRYLALGFALAPDRRELHDPAGTTEVRFTLEL